MLLLKLHLPRSMVGKHLRQFRRTADWGFCCLPRRCESARWRKILPARARQVAPKSLVAHAVEDGSHPACYRFSRRRLGRPRVWRRQRCSRTLLSARRRRQSSPSNPSRHRPRSSSFAPLPSLVPTQITPAVTGFSEIERDGHPVAGKLHAVLVRKNRNRRRSLVLGSPLISVQ